MAWQLEAPAKVNLGLRILGRREDGYHELDTVFHALDLTDEVTVDHPATDTLGIALSYNISAPMPPCDLPTDAGNLAYRAADAFFVKTGKPPACRIHLHKRIPAAAGLGGGSSDAATTLLLLNRLYEEPLDDAALQGICAQLGADVPFFLFGGSQRGQGIGERLAPLLNPPSLHFVLVFPPFGCETKRVYENLSLRLTQDVSPASISQCTTPEHGEATMTWGFSNDLEPAAMQVYPELRSIRDRLTASGFPQVHLSGSGSTLFLAFEDAAACDAAFESLRTMHGFTVWRTASAAKRGVIRAQAFPDFGLGD